MSMCKRVATYSALFGLVFLGFLSTVAVGGVITVTFSGTISQVGMGFISIYNFHTGDSFQGSFTYDSDTPLIADWDPEYLYYPNGDFSVTTGSLTYYRNQYASNEWYFIVENTATYDRLTLEAFTTGPSVSGSDNVDFYAYRSILMLTGPPNLFNSGALVTDPIPLSSFTSTSFTLELEPYPYGGGIFSGFSGSLSTFDITGVPEPSFFLLLGISVGAVSLICWRFKS